LYILRRTTSELISPDQVALPLNLNLRPDRRGKQVGQGEEELVTRKIEKEISEVERKLGILLNQILTQEFPEALVRERKNALLARREQLTNELNQLQIEVVSIFPSLTEEEYLLAFAERIQGSLQRLDFATKRQVMELIQLRVDVISQKQVRISAAIPGGQDILDLDINSDSRLGVSGPIVTTSYVQPQCGGR
jgi:hypothetical protein